MVRFRGFRSKVFAIAFLASLITATTMTAISLSAETISSSGGFSCISPTCQSGTSSCTVAINGNTCSTSTITFPVAYSSIPIIGQINETLNPITPVHAQSISQSATLDFLSQQPANHTRLMYANETLASKTIPNTDTIIRSYSGLSTPDIFVQPPDLTYPYVIVEAEGYITTNLITSTRQDISIMIEDTVYTSGSPFTTTIVQTIKINPEAVAASGKIPFAIKGADNILLEATYGYGVESINVIAPAADANTVANIVSMRVYAVENSFLSIPNMPIPLTEIYGSRIGWSVPFTTTYTPFFCINIIVSSWNASSTIIIQSSTDQTAWTTRSNIFINTIGISCVQTSIISLTAGTIYFRLASQSGGGIGDFPAISGIILTFTYSSTTNVPVGYGSAIILSLTSTSFKIKFQFDATITASNTITFNWRSIGS